MSDLELTGIRIAGIAGFDAGATVEFGPTLTVLAGRNNAGKSTVLRAIMLAIGEIGLAKRGNWQEKLGTLRRDREKPYSLSFFQRCKAGAFRASFAGASDFRVGIGGAALRNFYEHAGFENWDPAGDADVEFELEVGEGQVCVILLARQRDFPGRALRLGSSAYYAESGRAFVQAQEARFSQPIRGTVLNAFQPTSFAAWGYGGLPKAEEWQQHERRLQTDDDAAVQKSITFLRMMHPKYYERLEKTVLDAFPEFKAMTFLDKGGTDFIPAMMPKSGANDLRLGREKIGAGSWAFLSMLTAAHVAHATGAEYFVLDEPHLYMHPGLERRLLRELLLPKNWPQKKALRIVAATHSPAFVDAALERDGLRIMDWTTPDRAALSVYAIRDARKAGEVLNAPMGDLFYADQLVLVEGESDAAALRVLAAHCHVDEALDGVRFAPLLKADKHLKSEFGHVVDLISRSRPTGTLSRPLLVLDSDKEAACRKAWKSLSGYDDPQNTMDVEFVGLPGNDLESAFCHAPFLEHYFAERVPGVVPDVATTISTGLERLERLQPTDPPGKELSAKGKGCEVVRRLHEQILGAADHAKGKADYLVAMAKHFVKHDGELPTLQVAASLKGVLDALTKRSLA